MAKKERPPWYDDSLPALTERAGKYKITKADIKNWDDNQLAKHMLGLTNWLGAAVGTADNLILQEAVKDPVALHDLQEALLETAAYSLWLFVLTTWYINEVTAPKVHPGQLKLFEDSA